MQQTPSSLPAHIPIGVADYFGDEARRRRQMESSLLDSFRAWGYQDVIPPTFEYAQTLGQHTDAQVSGETYRFLDRDGSMLALRMDMTIAVARLVGTRLHDWPMPLRFCYAGSVFRQTEPQAGRQREFWQAGVELIGAAGAEADAEVLALTCQALDTAGLQEYRLALGQINYFHGLLDALQLKPDEQRTLQQAIDHNREIELASFLRNTTLSTQQHDALESLLELRGDAPDRVLSEARRLCLNAKMHAALDNLQAILAELDRHGIVDRIHLDLTEIHNLGYYTGITFEALTHGLGSPLASGGRYDNLIGAFGKAKPAVGVAIGIDRVLEAVKSQASRVRSQESEVNSPLTIALPKGRLAEDVLALFAKAGLPLPTNGPAKDVGRKLVLHSEDGEFHYVMAKPSDVPTYVEYGAADIGVCGLDVLREGERDVYEPLLLPFGHCRLSLAVPVDRPDIPLRYLSQARVATSYPRLSREFFRQRGINAEIIELNGSVELAPLVGLADFIVDLVQTGETLRANGLSEFRTILESQAVLIVNRAAQRLKANKVQQVVDSLRSVIHKPEEGT